MGACVCVFCLELFEVRTWSGAGGWIMAPASHMRVGCGQQPLSPLVRVGGITAPKLHMVELMHAEPVRLGVVALEVGIAHKLHLRASRRVLLLLGCRCCSLACGHHAACKPMPQRFSTGT